MKATGLCLAVAILGALPVAPATPVISEGYFQQMKLQVLIRNPQWLVDDLKPSQGAEVQLVPNGPRYYAASVRYYDRSDPNPLGPILVAVGLFQNHKFVRMANGDESQLCLKIISELYSRPQ